MEDLNNDVLENILFRLPLGTASQAKRVCISWKTILDSKRHDEVGFLFACNDYRDNKIQLYFGEEYDHIDLNKMKNYYSHDTIMEMKHCSFVCKYFPYQDDTLVGSCNGLVCFQILDPDTTMAEPFAICNPLTGEFIFLKANLRRVCNEPTIVSSGFGYCQSTKEYKVVRLYTLNGFRSTAQVYTLGSNKWRDIETSIMHTFPSPGIFANGFLLWLDYKGRYIAAFDLEDENFKALPPPPSEAFEGRDSHFVNKLNMLGGNLCLVQRNRTDSHINIWAYKKINLNTNGYYLGNSWNWVKEFSIESSDDYEPFAITKSNQVILLLETCNNFYCYDPKSTQTIRKHEHGDDNGMAWSNLYTQVIPHTNSYVSLKDFGETWYGPGCSEVPQTNSSVSLTEVRDAYYGCHKRIMDPYCPQCGELCGHTLLKDFVKTLYGQEVSAVPQTNSYVSLTEVRDAYVDCHEGIMDPYCQECGELCGHTYVPWIYNQ